MIQAHFQVGFFKIFLQNMFHLNDSINILNCWNQAQFLNKEIIMNCLATFTTPISKNIIATLGIVTKENPELTFLLIL